MIFYNSKGNIIQTTVDGELVNLDIDETNNGSIEHVELMKEDYIELHFSLKSPVYFSIGTYCTYNGKKYYVTEKQTPTISSSGYQYTLKMEAYYMLWKNILCMYNKDNGGEAGWSTTGNIGMFCNIFAAILAAEGITYNGKPITFVYDSTVTTDQKLVEFSQVSIIEGLNVISEKFECEWWVTDGIGHFGKCEISGDYTKLEEDDELGAVTRSGSSSTYANKIYAFGSDRNIPNTYRKHLIFTANTISTKDGKTVISDSTRPVKGDYFLKANQLQYSKDVAITGTLKPVSVGDFSDTDHSYLDFSFGKLKKGTYLIGLSGISAALSLTKSDTGTINLSIYYNESKEISLEAQKIENAASASHEFADKSIVLDSDIDDFVVRISTSSSDILNYSVVLSGNLTVMGQTYGATTKVTINGSTYDATVNPDLEYNNHDIVLSTAITVTTTDTFTLSDLVTSQVPESYYTADEGYVKNSVVQNRLALPASKSYVDKDDLTADEQNDLNIDDDEAEVPAIVIFDDEYPKIISTINAEPTVSRINDILDEKTLDSTHPEYTIKIDKPTDFDNKYVKKDSLMCVFQTGLLGGMEFGLQCNDGTFTLEPNTTYGRQLPDDILYPVQGDTLILYNYDTSYFYSQSITDAEEHLKATAIKYLKEKMFLAPSTYSCPMNMVRANGWVQKEDSEELVYADDKKISLELGNRVNFICPAYIKSRIIDNVVWGRKSRVIGYEKALDGTSCTYTVGETTAYSRLKTLESKVDSIEFNGSTYVGGSTGNGASVYLITSNDSTQATDANAYSAKRAKKEFLSRLYDDETAGNLIIDKDLTVKGETSLQALSATTGTFLGLLSALTVQTTDLQATVGTIDTLNSTQITVSKNVISPLFIGDLQGNADTATSLKTSRTINGTLFNGTSGITTSYWGISRDVTIGNTVKSLNGSSNTCWTIAEIGAVDKAGDTMAGTLNFGSSSYNIKSSGLANFAFGSTIANNTIYHTANANLLTVNWEANTLTANNAIFNNLTNGYLPSHTSAGLVDSPLKIVNSVIEIQASSAISTHDYVSENTGWNISYTGNADFRKIYSDELWVQAFTADISQALVGSDFLTKSVSKLSANLILPNSVSSTTQMIVDDLEGFPSTQCFVDGDYIRLRVIDRTGGGLNIIDVWGTVKLDTSFGTNGFSNGTQRYIFTATSLDEGAGLTVYKGSEVLDYGISGNGVITRTVLDSAGSPYEQITSWVSDPSISTNYTVHARLGNLAGIVNCSGYGLYSDNVFLTKSILIGDLTKSGNYLSFDTVNGLKIKLGSASVATVTDVNSSLTSANSTAQGYANSALYDAKSYVDKNYVLTTTYTSELTVLDNAISAKVSQTDFDTLGKTVSTHTSEIASNSTNISALLTSTNSLTNRMVTAEAKITDSAIIATVSSTINTAKDDAISVASSDAATKAHDAQTAAQGYADTAVNNVQIGGTNLVLYSEVNNFNSDSFKYDLTNHIWTINVPITANQNWGAGFYLSAGNRTAINPGEYLTYSCEVYSDVAFVLNHDVNNAANDGNSWGGNDNDDRSSEIKSGFGTSLSAGIWHKVWFTIKARADKSVGIQNANSNIGAIPQSSAYVIKVKHIKIEKGTKATDWSPAPEDVAQDATDKANNAYNNAKSYVDANYVTVSDYTSELSVLSTSIAAKVSQTDFDTLGDRVSSAESSINVNTKAISAKVSTTDYTGVTIASLINQSASTVTINASHINLIGSITMTALSNDAIDTIQGYSTSAQNAAISVAASDATTKANAAVNSAETYTNTQISVVNGNITSTINSIQVGGRNLAKNGSYQWGVGNNGSYLGLFDDCRRYNLGNTGGSVFGNFEFYALIPNMELVMEEYVVYSFDIKIVSGENGSFYCSAMSNDGMVGWWQGTQSFLSQDFSPSTEWSRVKIYAKTHQYNNADSIRLIFGFGAYSDSTITSHDPYIIDTRNFKVERGTKATDWTPAPEDVSSDITAAQTNAINQAGTNAASLYVTQTTYNSYVSQTDTALSAKVSQSDFNALGSRVSSAESAISVNTKAIATKVSQTDYDSNNTSIDKHFSTVEQTASGISTKVGTAQSTADTVQTDLTNYKSTVASTYSTIKQTSDSITVAISSTKTYADNSASTAQSNAVKAAATDATSKADKALSTAKSYTDTQITAVNGTISLQVTSVKTYVDNAASTAQSNAISTAAGDATSKANSAYNKAVSYTDSKITVTEGKITATVNTAISNIQVGGTNLFGFNKNIVYDCTTPTIDKSINGFSFVVPSSGINLRLRNLGFNSIGGTFTVSGYIKSSANTNSCFLNLCDYSPTSEGNIPITTSYVYFSRTYVNVSSYIDPSNYNGFLDFESCTSGVTIYVKNLKIERGNKATDWSPAPEDLDASISSKVSQSSYDANNVLIANQFTEIKQTSDSISLKVNSDGFVNSYPLAVYGKVTKGAYYTFGIGQDSEFAAVCSTFTGLLVGKKYVAKVTLKNIDCVSGAILDTYISASVPTLSSYNDNEDYQVTDYNDWGDIYIEFTATASTMYIGFITGSDGWTNNTGGYCHIDIHNISLFYDNVKNRLLSVGIDIDSNKITATANTLLIKDSYGNVNTIFETVGGKPVLKTSYLQTGNLDVSGTFSERYSFVNRGTLNIINFSTLNNVAVNRGIDATPAIIVLPMYTAYAGGNLNTAAYQKGGTNISIQNSYNVNMKNWKNAASLLNGTGKASLRYQLAASSVIIVSDPRIIAHNNYTGSVPTIYPNGSGNANDSVEYRKGRMFCNGKSARIAMILPGQTLRLQSGIETYNGTSYLVWYVVNASEYTSINKGLQIVGANSMFGSANSGVLSFYASNTYSNWGEGGTYDTDFLIAPKELDANIGGSTHAGEDPSIVLDCSDNTSPLFYVTER
jgi:hypothetical protein